jgi:hypothetical protein
VRGSTLSSPGDRPSYANQPWGVLEARSASPSWLGRSPLAYPEIRPAIHVFPRHLGMAIESFFLPANIVPQEIYRRESAEYSVALIAGQLPRLPNRQLQRLAKRR